MICKSIFVPAERNPTAMSDREKDRVREKLREKELLDLLSLELIGEKLNPDVLTVWVYL